MAAEIQTISSSLDKAASTPVVNQTPSEWTRQSISVVIASFTSHFVILGLIYSFGVYIPAYLPLLRADSSTVSLVGAISAGCLSGFGILSGSLADKYNYQLISFIGGCIITIGLIIASFSSDLYQFILTQGVIAGFGASLAYFPAVSAPSMHFNKNRGLAIGLAVSGSGVGGFFISIVLAQLLQKVGLPWTLRITAIFTFVALSISSYFLRIPPRDSALSKPKFPFHILKDPVFLSLALMPCLAAFGYLVPILFVPLYATSILNLAPTQGALAVALFNAASTFGRILIGFGADKAIGRLNAFILCVFASGASILILWPLAKSFEMLLFFTIANGFLCGGIISLPSSVMADIYGLDGLASMLGILFTAFTPGNVFGAPIAGIILKASTSKEGTADYIPMIMFAGGMQVFSCIFGIIAKVILDKRRVAQPPEIVEI